MKIECLNIIKRRGDKWEYNGRFYHNSKWIPVIGSVRNMKTESQIKRAIIKRLKAQAQSYKLEKDQPRQKKLSSDAVFKDILG